MNALSYVVWGYALWQWDPAVVVISVVTLLFWQMYESTEPKDDQRA